MNSRWDRFNEKHDDVNEYKKLRSILRITVYGSYYPESAKKTLIRQRNFLRNKGYSETSLVEDYSYGKILPLDKSIMSLENSDVNFLIFTKEGKNLGVTRELAHIATSSTMADKIPFCTVFTEIEDKSGSISVLSINDIENSHIPRREFQGEKQLQKALLQQAFAKTRKLKNELKQRL